MGKSFSFVDHQSYVEFYNVNVFLLNTKLIVTGDTSNFVQILLTFSWPIARKVRFFGCGNIRKLLKSIHLKKKCAQSSVDSKQGAYFSWGYLERFAKNTLFWRNWRSCKYFFLNDWTLTNLQYIYPCTLMYVSQRLEMGKNGTTPKGLFDVCQPRS